MATMKMRELRKTGEEYELMETIPYDEEKSKNGNYIVQIYGSDGKISAVRQHKELWTVEQLNILFSNKIKGIKLDTKSGGQREYVMSGPTEQSLFQSLIAGIVPNSLTFTTKYEVDKGDNNIQTTFECIDGKQRITAINRIYDDKINYPIRDEEMSINVFEKKTLEKLKVKSGKTGYKKVNLSTIRKKAPDYAQEMDNLQFQVIVYDDPKLLNACNQYICSNYDRFSEEQYEYEKLRHKNMINELLLRASLNSTNLVS